MTTPFPFVAGAVLTAAELNAITTLPINDQTDDYTLVVGDVGKRVVMNKRTANTVTVDDSIFAAGDTVEVLNKGAGATTLTAGAGVTLNGLSLVLLQYQSASVVFLSASSALVFPSGGSVKTTKVEAFAAGGTFTPPAGVTFAIAHIRAGGGGVGSASSGQAEQVRGICRRHDYGNRWRHITKPVLVSFASRAGAANSGQGANMLRVLAGDGGSVLFGGNGAYIVAGGAVTPAVGITVTVGAGGTAGTNGAAGGSGFVWIEYQE
jgi:hypothetical protein